MAAPIPVKDLFNDNDKEKICKLWKSGKTQKEIAEMFDVSRRTIGKLCKHLGLSRTHSEAQKSPWTKDLIKSVEEARGQGKTLAEISKLTGRSISSVERICRKHNIDRPELNLPSIKNEYENGKTISELAKEHRTSEWTIAKELREQGAKIRPQILQPKAKRRKKEIAELPEFDDSYEWFFDAYENRKYSINQIAGFLHKSVGFVSGKLSKYGIELRSLSEASKVYDEKSVMSIYQEQGSMAKVALHTGMTVEGVKRLLLRNGIKPAPTSDVFSGSGNPFYGKDHTVEIRQLCKETGTFYGNKFWEDHPEYIEVVREKQKIFWSDLSRREEDSRRITELRRQGKCKSWKGTVLSRFGEIPFDSSYEMAFIEYCENNKRIVNIERDFMAIEYRWQGATHLYNPDFMIWLINGDFIIVEIKAEFYAKQPKEREKIIAGFNTLSNKFMIVKKDFSDVDSRINLILEPQKFDFNNVVLEEANPIESEKFYNAYHYLGDRKGYTIGAKIDDLLIGCITFSSITRKEIAKKQKLCHTQVRELVRMCIHPEFHKPNFGSWLMSRAIHFFKEKYPDVKMLISFADTTQGHDGGIYKASNWLFDGETGSSYHYANKNGEKFHKKTIYDRAKSIGMKEREYAMSQELFRIEEMPKKRFLYKL